MKNIHVLPTDKPSRIYTCGTALYINKVALEHDTNQNIYITSDEEIKEGDWFYNIISLNPEPFKACENGDGYVNCSRYSHYRIDCKKIILTTDADLIKDGVQAISDDFLEWFVKNPSCESVEVKKEYITPLGDIVETCYDNERLNYKIIIPSEEPFIEYTNTNDCTSMIYNSKEEPKQEKMYSEEEVEMIANKMVNLAIDNIGNPFYEYHDSFNKPAFTEVLEQFKNK